MTAKSSRSWTWRTLRRPSQHTRDNRSLSFFSSYDKAYAVTHAWGLYAWAVFSYGGPSKENCRAWSFNCRDTFIMCGSHHVTMSLDKTDGFLMENIHQQPNWHVTQMIQSLLLLFRIIVMQNILYTQNHPREPFWFVMAMDLFLWLFILYVIIFTILISHNVHYFNCLIQ